jgi:hypothetical protein
MPCPASNFASSSCSSSRISASVLITFSLAYGSRRAYFLRFMQRQGPRRQPNPVVQPAPCLLSSGTRNERTARIKRLSSRMMRSPPTPPKSKRPPWFRCNKTDNSKQCGLRKRSLMASRGLLMMVVMDERTELRDWRIPFVSIILIFLSTEQELTFTTKPHHLLKTGCQRFSPSPKCLHRGRRENATQARFITVHEIHSI